MPTETKSGKRNPKRSLWRNVRCRIAQSPYIQQNKSVSREMRRFQRENQDKRTKPQIACISRYRQLKPSTPYGLVRCLPIVFPNIPRKRARALATLGDFRIASPARCHLISCCDDELAVIPGRARTDHLCAYQHFAHGNHMHTLHSITYTL